MVRPPSGFSRQASAPQVARDFEWFVRKSGYENDWYAASLPDQAILKIKSAHTPHSHVDY